jgi:protein-S-isoprenylcysteine O-methyltransferase Ste14
MTIGWVVKARLEEGFLREQLGAEAYDAYARHVPMLVPFLR